MIRFVLSQIFGLIALALVCLSYSFDNKKKFLAYQIIANIFYASSFLTLEVFVGGINTLISTLRVTILYFIEKKDKNIPTTLYVMFSFLYLLAGNVCFQSNYDILAIIAYEMFNMAMFMRDISLTRYMMIVPNMIIVVYNILSLTYTNAILDLIEIIVLVCMAIKFSFIMKHRKIKYLI